MPHNSRLIGQGGRLLVVLDGDQRFLELGQVVVLRLLLYLLLFWTRFYCSFFFGVSEPLILSDGVILEAFWTEQCFSFFLYQLSLVLADDNLLFVEVPEELVQQFSLLQVVV